MKRDAGMNPRYVAYARVHGKSPKEMLAHDKEAHPGGCMAGFILWISQAKRAYLEKNPVQRHEPNFDNAAFGLFIEEYVEPLRSP